MKNIKFNKKKLLAILLACGISLSNISIVSGESIKTIKVTGRHVNVRLEPNTNNKENIIGEANNGDTFTLIDHINNWYLVKYNDQEAYINDNYALIERDNNNIVLMGKLNSNNKILMGKLNSNNINIRLTPSTKENNIIGFADITDSFKIISKENDWYKIDYLGKEAYIKSNFINERMVNEEDLIVYKSLYLITDSVIYEDTLGTYLTVLPKYQYVKLLNEENGYYKVMVDGIIGYINPNDTKELTNTFVVIDLGRQIIKVFKNNEEVHRAHIISGCSEEKTDIGIFKIGHRLTDYQLTPTKKVSFWMQYNGNEGIHDAYWQEHKYFTKVAEDAYKRFKNGNQRTYPYYHGSQGCDNLEYPDAKIIYDLVRVGDNVLVIGPNNLVKDNLISSNIECKELQKVLKYI